MNRRLTESQHRSRATWVFGGLAFAFFIWVFIFAPETLPEYKHRVLALVAALLTGLFAYFLTGDIGVDVQFIESRFGKASVKATGGIGVFVFVLMWWFSPWAPVKREALEEVKKGTEEIKKDTGAIKSDISDLKNTTTQLLEEFRRSQQVRTFQGRAEKGIVEKPSPRAHELAAKIPDDADPYSLALKAIAQGRNDDASRRLDEAQKTKEIELSKIYEAKGLAEKFAGRFSSSIDWFKKALALSPDNPELLHWLGTSFLFLGKYSEAGKHLRRALEVQEQAHSHRGSVASILHDLGLVYYFQEKYVEAESFYKRAQEADSSEYADLSPLLKLGYKTMTIRGLGQVYMAQHKYSEAEDHFVQAIDNFDDCVNLLGEGSNLCSSLFYIGWNLNDLADLYFLQARYSEALPHVKRGLKIQQQESPPDHLDIAATLIRMALLNFVKADYAEAERLLRRANGHINLVVPVFLLKPPQRLVTFYVLASIYTEWGQHPKAERFFCRALLGYESLHSPDRFGIADNYNGLARLRLIQGKYAEADILANQALEVQEQAIREKGVRSEQRGMVDSLNILGELSRRQGRLVEAESLFQQALGIAEKTLGSGHSQRVLVLNNLAAVYVEQERFDDAERGFREAVKISEKTLGLDHPQVAMWLGNLAELYHRQGRHAEAASLEARAKRIWTMYPAVAPPRLPSKPDMHVDLVDKSPCHNKGGTG